VRFPLLQAWYVAITPVIDHKQPPPFPSTNTPSHTHAHHGEHGPLGTF